METDELIHEFKCMEEHQQATVLTKMLNHASALVIVTTIISISGNTMELLKKTMESEKVI